MKPSKMTLATTFVTLAALGVFASACSSSSKTASPDVTTATTTTLPAPAAVTVTATDYAFSGVPATLEAGLLSFKFVNKGSVNHELAFLKVTNNTDTEAAFTSLAKIFNGEPFPANFLGANGVHDTKPGTTSEAQLNLTPGQYIALCSDSGIAGTKKDGKPHFSRGMFKKLTVTGTGGDTPPAVGSVLTAHDYSFDISQLKAGPQTISFVNKGPTQWHFGDIQVFPKGTTVAQGQAAIVKLLASQGPPPAGVAQPEEVGASNVASPGLGNTFTATLEKGRTYVVFCFISDQKGGPPHAISHHMYKVFTIS